MQQMTINDFFTTNNYSVSEVSKKTGLSQALLSLLKNEKIPLSDKTIKIFEDCYQVTLVDSNPLFLAQKEIERLNSIIQEYSNNEKKHIAYQLQQVNKCYLIKNILSMNPKCFTDKNLKKFYSLISKINDDSK